MTLDGFGDLACGSNGGPPRQKIEEWAEFRKCRAETNGLHEVYARFDDEEEYVGKAIDEPLYARGKIGTRVAGHPVILSVLFDDDGVLRGIRFVTDPRAPSARAPHGASAATRGHQSLRARRMDLHGSSASRRAKRRSAASSSSSTAKKQRPSATSSSTRAFCASPARATTIP